MVAFAVSLGPVSGTSQELPGTCRGPKTADLGMHRCLGRIDY